MAVLRRFHYDTAQAVPASRILYGTDSWFRSSVESAEGLQGARVFRAGELRSIGRDNALPLMPPLATTLG